jgi:hypothetical protein
MKGKIHASLILEPQTVEVKMEKVLSLYIYIEEKL